MPRPPPPVPRKLRELLGEYPEYIARLQDVLADYAAKPFALMPFDGAIWALEGRLETFMSEADQQLSAAEASGDPEAIARAEKKRFDLGYARMNMLGLSDLRSYFEETGA